MRRFELKPEHNRGSILTHGSLLTVTSNPDRTSPVKRGLFILDNILGMPTGTHHRQIFRRWKMPGAQTMGS